MTKNIVNKLAPILAKKEGKKSQVKIGDMRETVKALIEVIAEENLREVTVEESTLHAIENEAAKLADKLRNKK